MTRYLRPTAPIAADVLLPADPGLAMVLAQRLMSKPLMANHHHGLWGYSGTTADGRELTVQSTGIGGPSAAAVLGELAGHGARRLIRVGICTALDLDLALGDRVVAEAGLAGAGVSSALGVSRSRPDPGLTAALASALDARRVLVAGADLHSTEAGSPFERRGEGAAAVDLETAALFALGERLPLGLAAVLVVGERAGLRADDAALEQSLVEAAVTVISALGQRAAA